MREAALKIVSAARAHNKCIATACAPEEYDFWLSLEIDLLFCTNDVACLKQAAADLLGEARGILERKAGEVAHEMASRNR